MHALLLTVLFLQDPAADPPKPAPTPEAKPVEAAIKVSNWTDPEAKAATAELSKTLKTETAMAGRLRAIESLAPGSHKLLVKPLVQIVKTDKTIMVRKRAAQLLGQQPAKECKPELLKLLGDATIRREPAVLAEVIRSLARCGYDNKCWEQLKDMLEADYAAERVPVHEAILDLVAEHKERDAVPMLLRNLDEPIPEDVDAGHNPPASYWEARWKAWAIWRERVKTALFAITGQRFSTAAEARKWLRANPLK